jgi:superfamily II DNA/RNA helicase
MKEILALLPKVQKKILTSATQEVEIPKFVGLTHPIFIDYLEKVTSQLKVRKILSSSPNKLQTLAELLCHLGNQPGIVFCNFKDTIQEVSDFLNDHNIAHGCFYGGMEQKDRERALIKFRNGTHQLIVATDLAARGIDIPEIRFIIHFQLPQRAHEFIHRNGRTARMFNDGTAYVIKGLHETLPDFIENCEVEKTLKAPVPSPSIWKTVFVSGGRKDKISKGDIAGLFMKQGQLGKDQIGIIEIKTDCAFVAVHASEVNRFILLVDNSRLKNKKVRVTII